MQREPTIFAVQRLDDDRCFLVERICDGTFERTLLDPANAQHVALLGKAKTAHTQRCRIVAGIVKDLKKRA
jgi:hypothetical protein